jgi:hypothetical protein
VRFEGLRFRGCKWQPSAVQSVQLQQINSKLPNGGGGFSNFRLQFRCKFGLVTKETKKSFTYLYEIERKIK